MARELLWLECGWCGQPDWQALRETVCALIRYHSLPPHAVDEESGPRLLLKDAANGELLPNFNIELLCLLAKADILGRVCGDRDELLEAVELCGALAEEEGCLTGPRAFPSRHTAFSYFSGKLGQPDCELSSLPDCSEALLAAWRAAHPSAEARMEELEALVAGLLFGGNPADGGEAV